MHIIVDDLTHPAIHALLEEHLADMRATSPPESVHALDLTGLRHPSITFFSAWEQGSLQRTSQGTLLGCIAIKLLDAQQAEIKSMRTPKAARGKGTAKQLLKHLMAFAEQRGIRTLYLETGSMAFFEPARQLYLSHGFEFCGPFADYTDDPNSCFMTRTL
ncbi:GNAT family N-acetyltransferase [Aestuariibacter sp. GS-14]|uniref:GNAT family N-acetyltransferase n=1 Tax=Aestuariibacter sp. GS-14 TaxID=2590670 RepID=UPI00112B80D5|nr:GNAT family N-acetyltransferase [Aestuariibacter sp. GS-14]TPV55645.1 GNAT family N-acetyltransferase [Aestuariibacter sp. GS-14]